MNLKMIVAASENDVIGIGNRIPWKISDDMRHFKELTIGHNVIMGRKTWDSIDEQYKPLIERKNIVLSGNMEPREGIYIARDIDEAIKLTSNEMSYVMGGAEVYKAFLPLINTIELTRIHKHYDGDVFLPRINLKNWKLTNKEDKITKKDVEYSFETYVRRF